jgi:hypothetical protein
VGLGVVRLAPPIRGFEIEVEALVVTFFTYAVLGVDEPDPGGVEVDAGLFASFADGSGERGLAALEVAGREAVVAVSIAGVGSLKEENFATGSPEDDVRGGDEPMTVLPVGHALTPGSLTAIVGEGVPCWLSALRSCRLQRVLRA